MVDKGLLLNKAKLKERISKVQIILEQNVEVMSTWCLEHHQNNDINEFYQKSLWMPNIFIPQGRLNNYMYIYIVTYTKCIHNMVYMLSVGNPTLFLSRSQISKLQLAFYSALDATTLLEWSINGKWVLNTLVE